MYLGNLSIESMERRAGVQFPQELKDFMKGSHQEIASDIKAGKWHCFDMPFILVCGGNDMAQKIYGFLAPLSAQFKEPLHIGVV